MLTLLAHQGTSPDVHDLWLRWNADPLVILGLGIAMWGYHRGVSRRRPGREASRARCFWMGLAAVAGALLSPLDPLAAELASAHMIQHVLLVLVAAPLLAYSAPVVTMLAGAPRSVRRSTARVRRRLRTFGAPMIDTLRRPGAAWLLHAATLWLWHASAPYDAALEHPGVHAIEHASFVATGVLFWSALRRLPTAASHGYAALLVFTMAMQSVILAALLTFATAPWYAGYRQTTQTWGFDPLADQQLAGVIMWVPAGLIYVAVGVALIAAWVRDSAAPMIDGRFDDDWRGGAAPDRPLTRLR